MNDDTATTGTDLANAVKKMRDCQKRYFRDRLPSQLNEARDAERRVDRLVEQVLSGPGLFGST